MVCIPRKIDYTTLWKSGASEKAPRKSIIGGLQKLLNEKEDQIIQLSAQVEGLKERIIEYNDVMEQMEQQFLQQQEKIKQLEQNSGGFAPTISTPSLGGSANDKETIKRLQNQIREMENKLYLFSNLPTRITDLEAKIEEKNKIIEQYDDQVEKLKATIRKISAEGGADQIIKELQQKVQQQQREIEKLQKELENQGFGGSLLGNTISTPNLGITSNNSEEQDREISNLRRQVSQLMQEKTAIQQQFKVLQQQNMELQAKLDNARRSIQTLQLKINSSTPATTGLGLSADQATRIAELEAQLKNKEQEIIKLKQAASATTSNLGTTASAFTPNRPVVRSNFSEGSTISHPFQPSPSSDSTEVSQLRLENTKLKNKIEDLEQKLKAEQQKIEEIVERVQAQSKSSDLLSEIESLKAKVQELTNINQQLNRQLKEKDEFMQGMSGSDLITNLNLKITKLKAKNRELEEKLKNAQLSTKQTLGTLGGPKPIKAPSLPSAPKIREIDSGASKEKEMQLQQKISELQKQIAEKDAQLAKNSQELIEVQTELAKLKASGPQTNESANMMELLQDLQLKIRRLKEQIRKKDEIIASLQK